MAQSPPQLTGKSLFSLHYLDTRLPAQPEWHDDARPAFDAVRALWQKARTLGDTWNEAQTEDEFVKPVLELLGWHFIVQAKSTKQGRINRPDYALFADDGPSSPPIRCRATTTPSTARRWPSPKPNIGAGR